MRDPLPLVVDIGVDHGLFPIILRIQLMVKTTEQIFCERGSVPGKLISLPLELREQGLTEKCRAEPFRKLVHQIKLLFSVLCLVDHVV